MLPLTLRGATGVPDSKIEIASLRRSVRPLAGIAAPCSLVGLLSAVAKLDQLKIKINQVILIYGGLYFLGKFMTLSVMLP
jgi:hypothetical protein